MQSAESLKPSFNLKVRTRRGASCLGFSVADASVFWGAAWDHVLHCTVHAHHDASQGGTVSATHLNPNQVRKSYPGLRDMALVPGNLKKPGFC
eukprot:1737346-Rhodomonas_salina.2